MDVWALAERHAAIRRRTAAAAVLAATVAWRGMDSGNLAGSWLYAGPRIYSAAYAGQVSVASTASGYVSDALNAQIEAPRTAAPVVDPAAFAGAAADGRPLASLLRLPLARTYTDLSAGFTPADAMGRGEALLRMLVDTEVADAGRTADGVAMTADHRVEGYIRIVSAAACGRCILLAGKRYRYNAAFARHPHCHCQQVPEASTGDLAHHLTDPHAAFERLTPVQQDRAFTVAGAKAIRDGADVGQVVNARRGMYTAHIFSRDLQVTTEGATRHSLYKKAVRDSGRPAPPVRLTPDAIYRIASDRDDAVRLLRRYGYLL